MELKGYFTIIVNGFNSCVGMISFFAGSLESANSSILAVHRHF